MGIIDGVTGLVRGATDEAARIAGDARDAMTEVSEPVIRLGVTGLSRAGKTVFIASLVSNLMDRGRMPALAAEAEGRILAAHLRPSPDRGTPRFELERHLDALTGPDPRWPDSTRAISRLRLSFRVRPRGWIAGLAGPRTVHLDITDYPGEWLLDLGMMRRSFRDWSDEALAAAESPARAPHAGAWREALAAADPAAPFDEAAAEALARPFAAYLRACKDARLSGLSPGRFLLPGELEGSPALTFAPLPPGRARRGSLAAEFEKRFEAYKREIATPFFRDHFSRIERQAVLVDVLSALSAGPAAVQDLGDALARILACFRHGGSSWLAPLLGRRVEKLLFVATKADHVHHLQHPRMEAFLQGLLRRAADRAAFDGARVEAMAVAGLRATEEAETRRNGQMIHAVRGRLADGRTAILHPGDMPEDPGPALAAARAGELDWPGGGWDAPALAPPALSPRPGEGPPHIRLDRAAEFLFGDRLG